MNRFKVLVMAGILAFCALNAHADEISLNMDPGSWTIRSDASGDTIVIPDYGPSGSPGAPLLPVLGVNVLLPPDTDMGSLKLSITDFSIQDLPPGLNIPPAPPVVADSPYSDDSSMGDSGLVDGKDMAIYGTDAFYPPSDPVRLYSTAQMRKWEKRDRHMLLCQSLFSSALFHQACESQTESPFGRVSCRVHSLG